MEQIFAIGSSLAMAGWVLLVFLPYWRGLAQMVAGVLIPGLLALAYAALIAVWWSRAEGGFGSIEDVRALFTSTPLLVAGWLHYLAFDLFVGAHISREARREGIPHLLIIPLLPLTLMFGPAGYLAWLGLRTAWRSGNGQIAAIIPAPVAAFWRDLASRERALVTTGLLLWLAMIPTAIAYGLDDRTIAGVNVWLKPLKFQASLGLFALTLAFFMPMASDAFRRSWAGRFVVWGFIIPTAYEILYICWRSSLGEASHFNLDTPLAEWAYRLMGIGAVTLTATAPVLAYGILRKDAPEGPYPWRLAVALGLVLTFAFGALSGLRMGGALSHAVGMASAGDTGLPILGWLRTAGDLRVAHFFGLHAQQLVPILAALLLALRPSSGGAAIVVLAAIYAIVCGGLFVQALVGMPFLPA